MMIAMTGGTSGLGLVACARMVQHPDVRLLLGTRGKPVPGGSEELPLELADLHSASAFAQGVVDWLGGRSLDALVLNAGVSGRDTTARTVDGFERTFAVNHLAHFVISRALLPHLSPGARVIITTSGTHDPERGTRLPPPRHATAELLAEPERERGYEPESFASAGHAYAASKLCNILTVRAIAGRISGTAVAFDPGPVPGTGLARELSPALRLGWWMLGRLRLPWRRTAVHVAGQALAQLALGDVAPPPARHYVSLHAGGLRWVPPSELARRDDLRDALWRDSAALVDRAAARRGYAFRLM